MALSLYDASVANYLQTLGAVGGFLDKGLAHEVGGEQGDPAGATVLEGGLHHSAKIRFGGHVTDCVVHEHGIEGSTQAQGAYVALEVLAFGVQRSAHGQHVRR